MTAAKLITDCRRLKAGFDKVLRMLGKTPRIDPAKPFGKQIATMLDVAF